MSCTHPLTRIESRNGKITFESADLKDREASKKYFQKLENSGYIKSVKMIPCGRCMGCRLDYAKEWANRIVLESKKYNESECYFITLTYDNEHIPKKINPETLEISYSLKPDDLTSFMKKLRRHWEYNYNHNNIRFFGCGEYGTNTMRPHYHIILFNLKYLTDLEKFGENELGQSYYTSKTLEKIWGKGNVLVGGFSWNSANYVARYVVKKKYGQDKEIYDKLGIIPEFVRMSHRPGIGREYYEENKDKIYKNDEIFISVNDQVRKIQPPKYYDKLLEQDNPEKYKEIKMNRDKKNENNTRNTTIKLKTVDNVQRQRETKARDLDRKATFLKRGI